MRVLCYLMFRIYQFYTDRGIERDIPFFYMSLAVTVLVGINLYTLFFALTYFNIIKSIPDFLSNRFYALIPISALWCIIYFGIARPKKFLNYGFEKTSRGGVRVVGYIIFTALAFILIANLNRSKLIEEKLTNQVSTKEVQKRPSLEGRIRKWFKDKF